ncbi:GGDEF domain-containing response regulator [Desulfogranum japonicum]|uniref:GGDEF domain-containing response regulator n=1 Tax=Desulfogranum japonicum TaxID=231447 RepID=UPI00042212D9|nr:diguanylate cyclase [Desulfogranum japonicum]
MSKTPPGPRKGEILIVDDSPTNIHVLVQTLGEEYELRVARDGMSALELLSNSDLPDLILLDVMMPGMDGYEVCRQIKANSLSQDIPVIFISTMDEVENETRGLELGAVDYITKPFNAGIVRLRVKNHIELKQQKDTLARLSLTDGLTGIPNRRAFDETLDKEWKRARRLHAPVTLLMIDIDDFKKYNDHYGHLAGDDCLKRLVAIFPETLTRAGDFYARYGGEELACILPDTDDAGGLYVAEQIQHRLHMLAIEHAASSVGNRVTVSVGVASACPQGEEDSHTIVDRADKALYLAKSRGKNTIEI